jgi:hypothetical protein
MKGGRIAAQGTFEDLQAEGVELEALLAVGQEEEGPTKGGGRARQSSEQGAEGRESEGGITLSLEGGEGKGEGGGEYKAEEGDAGEAEELVEKEQRDKGVGTHTNTTHTYTHTHTHTHTHTLQQHKCNYPAP